MATHTNKQKLLNLLFSCGKKILEGEPSSPSRGSRGGACSIARRDAGPTGGTSTVVGTETRPVLEEFVYGLCRENATRDEADAAYRGLCDRFFDWNEVRVSSQREIEEALGSLPPGDGRAQRMISFLQEVFETTFSFNLEDLHKQGLKQAAKKIARYQAANDYVGAWVVQRSLGGHAIPVDAPTLRCARRLGLVGDSETVETARASLEHLVPKARGPLFTDVLSSVARESCWEGEPNCPACPLSGECTTGQEVVRESAGTRGGRAKPR
jgi:endonuclease III